MGLGETADLIKFFRKLRKKLKVKMHKINIYLYK